MKDRFFSIIAHDLKSPFTALLGMSQLIEMKMSDQSKEQIVGQVTVIRKSAEMIFELLENLLEWARVQMEQEKIDPVRLDISELIDECVQVMTGPAERKAIILTGDAPSIDIMADRDMVQLVIRNLIANAIKFTPSDGTIQISALVTGRNVEVSICDSGNGIDPELSNSLFAIDKKTTRTGTDGEVGTGLGLPLCKQVVELNGGTIWFDSEQGKGTTFTFTLLKAE